MQPSELSTREFALLPFPCPLKLLWEERSARWLFSGALLYVSLWQTRKWDVCRWMHDMTGVWSTLTDRSVPPWQLKQSDDHGERQTSKVWCAQMVIRFLLETTQQQPGVDVLTGMKEKGGYGTSWMFTEWNVYLYVPQKVKSYHVFDWCLLYCALRCNVVAKLKNTFR